MRSHEYDHISLVLTDKQLHLLLGGEQLAATLDGTKATIVCRDATTECNTNFANGGVLVRTKRDVIGRLLDGAIDQMGAFVYNREHDVLGNLSIRMISADPTPEELAAKGSETLARIFAIAAEPARLEAL